MRPSCDAVQNEVHSKNFSIANARYVYIQLPQNCCSVLPLILIYNSLRYKQLRKRVLLCTSLGVKIFCCFYLFSFSYIDLYTILPERAVLQTKGKQPLRQCHQRPWAVHRNTTIAYNFGEEKTTFVWHSYNKTNSTQKLTGSQLSLPRKGRNNKLILTNKSIGLQ